MKRIQQLDSLLN